MNLIETYPCTLKMYASKRSFEDQRKRNKEVQQGSSSSPFPPNVSRSHPSGLNQPLEQPRSSVVDFSTLLNMSSPFSSLFLNQPRELPPSSISPTQPLECMLPPITCSTTHGFPSSSPSPLTSHVNQLVPSPPSSISPTQPVECMLSPISCSTTHSFPSSSLLPSPSLSNHLVPPSSSSFISLQQFHSSQADSERAFHHSSPTSSHVVPITNDGEGDECKLLKDEVQIVDKEGKVIKTKKLSVKDVHLLGEGERVLVKVNEYNQPIQAAGGLCTRFLTTLLSQPSLCPPDAESFREVRKYYGPKLIDEVRVKFDLPNTKEVNRVLYAHFDSKYRNLKYRLKQRLLKQASSKLDEKRRATRVSNVSNGEEEVIDKEQYSTEELLDALDMVDIPDGFLGPQWDKFKANLRNDKAKNLSLNGKVARAEQLHVRTTGSISNARKRDEFKLKNKRPPTEVEAFELIYQTSEGKFVKDASSNFMEDAKELIKEKKRQRGISGTMDPKIQKEIETEVWHDLMGGDKPGRARGYGIGVTSSQITPYNDEMRRMMSSHTNFSNQVLLNRLAEQDKHIAKQDKHIAALENVINDCRGEMKVLSMACGLFSGPNSSTSFGKRVYSDPPIDNGTRSMRSEEIDIEDD